MGDHEKTFGFGLSAGSLFCGREPKSKLRSVGSVEACVLVFALRPESVVFQESKRAEEFHFFCVELARGRLVGVWLSLGLFWGLPSTSGVWLVWF